MAGAMELVSGEGGGGGLVEERKIEIKLTHKQQ